MDKLHFPGHKKSEVYCQENCNPRTVLKELGMVQINSPACEQAFKWINKFKNLKTMNEARFKKFLLYLTDLHNLHIEGKISVVANPFNADRIKVAPGADDDLVLKMKTMDIVSDTNKDNVTDLKSCAVKLTRIEDCYTINSEGVMCCNFCPGKYKREGHLKNHIESKHNIDVDLICVCGQTFSETTRYNRHKKTCK